MSDIKKCKHCQSEIDKKAKVCPNCRKKQGGKLKVILITLLALAIIGAMTNKDDEPKVTKVNSSAESETKEKAKEPEPTKAPEQTTFKVGEEVELNDILATLVGVKESTGGDFNKPSDGNVFVLCEFEIENNSEKDITVSSMLSFEAYCDSYAVNQSISGLLEKGDKNQLDGSVAAKKKMNGVIAYEVPENWKEFEINFTPSFWSGKDITFIAAK